MGLMMARVSHALAKPAITIPAAMVGTATIGTGLLVGAQYGLQQDFDKPAPPGGKTIGWSIAAGTIGGAIGGGMAMWGETPGVRKFGRGMLAVTVGAAGAILIGAPVVRRMMAGD